jgi:hypothetical protein
VGAAVGEAGGGAGVSKARSARRGALAMAITTRIALIITAPDAPDYVSKERRGPIKAASASGRLKKRTAAAAVKANPPPFLVN